MENVDSIIQTIGEIMILLVSVFAGMKIQQISKKANRDRDEIDALAKQGHKVIEVEAEEDHEEVTEALEKKDASVAISNLFNDRAEQ